MPIQQITPNEAKEILDRDSKAVYVDVRSVPEFTAGHPAGAINIPLLNAQGGQMMPNPDFQKVTAAVLPKDKKLIVGCMSGGRSQKACQILEQQGYKDLSNVIGGFGGGQNPQGPMPGAFQKGWKDLGLPVNQENGEGVGYQSLLSRA